jgi:RimJ/RimL family protein N-acetyltransferase
MQLAHVPLTGRTVSLEPYEPGIRSEVRAALDCDPEAWQLFATSGAGEHFDRWWDVHRGAGWMAYAIRRRATGEVVGSTSFLNINPATAVVEIGATFIRPDARGTDVNPEAKLLMLGHAFACGARRVELLTDARNARSRAAIAKLGAVEEGTLRRDRITWTGHVRDTVVFAVTDLDWPAVRARLEQRLGQ